MNLLRFKMDFDFKASNANTQYYPNEAPRYQNDYQFAEFLIVITYTILNVD